MMGDDGGRWGAFIIIYHYYWTDVEQPVAAGAKSDRLGSGSGRYWPRGPALRGPGNSGRQVGVIKKKRYEALQTAAYGKD